jgi:hypothetical protein
MKRYITGSYGLIIEEVDFIKESEHTLWYKSKNGHNYNCRKNSTYAQVHETFDSAKSFLLKKESINAIQKEAIKNKNNDKS